MTETCVQICFHGAITPLSAPPAPTANGMFTQCHTLQVEVAVASAVGHKQIPIQTRLSCLPMAGAELALEWVAALRHPHCSSLQLRLRLRLHLCLRLCLHFPFGCRRHSRVLNKVKLSSIYSTASI